MYQATTALRKILRLKKRIRIIQGGTSASKTISILLYLIDKAQRTEGLSISVVSESMPHLKRGAMRDFLNIMQAHNYYSESQWNRSDSTYHFSNGSYIEFFSADDPAKLRGARRDILFINECNNISYFAYEQLEVRTRLEVILDFNPVSEFWVHTEVIPNNDHDFLILTYLDNEALDPLIIQSIESRRNNSNWWKVYGMGQVGINEGQVYDNWEPIDEIPGDALLQRHGLDFGYTTDPSGIVDIYKWNDAFIFDEVLYERGQSNLALANAIRVAEGLDPCNPDGTYSGYTKILTIADSSEPKSIDEIKKYGVEITGSIKGPGSVNFGIQVVQNQKIHVTKRSTNIWKEYHNYLWKTDRNGLALNVPEDIWNHLMDAGRYGIVDLKSKREARAFANKPEGF